MKKNTHNDSHFLQESLSTTKKSEEEIVLSDFVFSEAGMRLVKCAAGTLVPVPRSSPPAMVFGISGQNMAAAFWEFLKRLTAQIPAKEKTLRKLSDYLEKLKNDAAHYIQKN